MRAAQIDEVAGKGEHELEDDVGHQKRAIHFLESLLVVEVDGVA